MRRLVLGQIGCYLKNGGQSFSCLKREENWAELAFAKISGIVMGIRQSAVDQFTFLVLTNSPISLCKSQLHSVSFSFLKWRIKQMTYYVLHIFWSHHPRARCKMAGSDHQESYPHPFVESMTRPFYKQDPNHIWHSHNCTWINSIQGIVCNY